MYGYIFLSWLFAFTSLIVLNSLLRADLMLLILACFGLLPIISYYYIHSKNNLYKYDLKNYNIIFSSKKSNISAYKLKFKNIPIKFLISIIIFFSLGFYFLGGGNIFSSIILSFLVSFLVIIALYITYLTKKKVAKDESALGMGKINVYEEGLLKSNYFFEKKDIKEINPLNSGKVVSSIANTILSTLSKSSGASQDKVDFLLVLKDGKKHLLRVKKRDDTKFLEACNKMLKK